MATRKDKNGYALRRGESQRKKDGRYIYSWTDRKGIRNYAYAATLQELRKKEAELHRMYEDGLDPVRAAHITVNDAFDKYISQRPDLKDSTRQNYIYVYNRFVRPEFGKRKIQQIHYSDVKQFYYDLMKGKGIKANTLDGVNTLLHPTFQLAVRDDLIRKNPSDGVMTEIKKLSPDFKRQRHALTRAEQKAFMDYLTSHNEFYGWVPIITVLLGTGMRIGECLGLCWNDLDFDNKRISVNKTLIYRPGPGDKQEVHISTTKTEAGTRTIPMIDDVYDAFLEEYQIQKILGFSKNEVDGYSGFVFATSEGNSYIPECVNGAIDRIIKAYNKEETEIAEKEKREPLLLPHFSAHHLRHTFCTRLCESESNIKVIQSVMGHADFSTTMDIYAECSKEKQQEVFAELNGKVMIK